MTLDKILKTFKKTLTKLDDYIEQQSGEVERNNDIIVYATQNKREAEESRTKAQQIKRNIENIVGEAV